MAVPKLTVKQWNDVRSVWEGDPRDGFTWLVRELDLPVSVPGVRKAADRDGWQKRVQGSNDSNSMAAKPTKSAKPSQRNQKPEKPTRETRNQPEKPETKLPKKSDDSHLEFGEEDDLSGDANDDGSSGRQESSDKPTGHPRARNSMSDCAMDDFKYGGLSALMGIEHGATTLYRQEYALIALRFMMLGATIEDLAELIGVSRTTIYNWQEDNKEFSTAIAGGRNYADANVASRLYQRAMGYTHEAEEIKVADGVIHRVPVTKHYPPDPQSAMFWLKNRQPELWKDKVEVVERPTIAIVDKEAMNNMYERVLAEAEIKRQELSGRAERLGMVIDSELDDGS